MTLRRFLYIAIITIFMVTCFDINSSMAQNSDNDVKSLDDIFSSEINYGNDGKPLTSTIMANHYYKTCSEEESLVFDEEEKQILCGCSSAKMSEILSVKEFMDLKEDTVAGRKARGKMLAYAYAPCMEYVIEEKVRTDCYKSNLLKDIIRGKRPICKCVKDRFKIHIRKMAPYIITNATHYEPMTLDPLEYYFTQKSYPAQRKVFVGQCRYDFEYGRDNKR